MNNFKYIQISDTDKDKTLEILGNTYFLNDDYVLCNVNDNTEVLYSNEEIKNILSNNNINYWDVIKCPDCGEYTDSYCYINSKNDDFYVCDNCSENYFYCEDCNEYYDDTYDTYETEDGRYICQDCRYDHYIECRDCGEIVHVNNSYYCEECDENYCSSCWDEHYHENNDNLLYDYHEFRDWVEHRTSDEPEPPFYIGHELEIDDGHNMEEAVDIINSIDGICMHDGSLSENGIEFISHPLSYNYMLSQETYYRKAFENLTDLGYKSHNTTTCGLHFHVTRPQNSQVIDRIILFMETYKEEIIKLSRRKTSELNRWSRFLSDKKTGTRQKVIKSLDYIVNNKDTSDRYMALNLTNRKTIEFRFFKGTLKYETFMADFEFINNLVMFASDLSIPVEELTWTKITSVGHFLPQYITEHELQCDKPIIDYSKELLIEFNEKKSQLMVEIDTLTSELFRRISNKARQKNKTYAKIRSSAYEIQNCTKLLQQLNIQLYNIENLGELNYVELDSIQLVINEVKKGMSE